MELVSKILSVELRQVVGAWKAEVVVTNSYGAVTFRLDERQHNRTVEYMEAYGKRIDEMLNLEGNQVGFFFSNEKLHLPKPPMPKPALFPHEGEGTVVQYSDRQGSRDRQIIGYAYCRNRITMFYGDDIPGILVVSNRDYTKNGKWSYTLYTIQLAPGWKFGEKRQDWDNGDYFTANAPLKTIAQELGLEGLTDLTAVERFMATYLPRYHRRRVEYMEKMEALLDTNEEAGGIMEVFYDPNDGTRKQGMKWLIVDGEVWHENLNPMQGKVLIIEKPRGVYKLHIADTCEWEQLYEWDYGNDCMESRGYHAEERGLDRYMVK